MLLEYDHKNSANFIATKYKQIYLKNASHFQISLLEKFKSIA